jgi:hypothetical protein
VIVFNPDVAWQLDGRWLPVNGSRIEVTEPTRTKEHAALTNRQLLVQERARASPRVTQKRTLTLDFPPLSLAEVQWFRVRLRLQVSFLALVRLLDAQGATWDQLGPDPDPLFPERWWGTLPYWGEEGVALRVDGVVLAPGAYLVNPVQGQVDFPGLGLDPLTAVVEAQYRYAPLVRLVSLEAQPRGRTVVPRFDVKLVMVEV